MHVNELMIAFKDAIKQVMHAPMSFFETTVRMYTLLYSEWLPHMLNISLLVVL